MNGTTTPSPARSFLIVAGRRPTAVKGSLYLSAARGCRRAPLGNLHAEQRIATLDRGRGRLGELSLLRRSVADEAVSFLFFTPTTAMATPSLQGVRPPPPKDATPPATPHTPTATNTPPARAVESTKPLYAVSYRGVSAAVFADSREQTTLNVTLRKSYRDADGKWQHTHTLKTDELPAATLALQKCYEWLVQPVRLRSGSAGDSEKQP